jgi:hypothetical protein
MPKVPSFEASPRVLYESEASPSTQSRPIPMPLQPLPCAMEPATPLFSEL